MNRSAVYFQGLPRTAPEFIQLLTKFKVLLMSNFHSSDEFTDRTSHVHNGPGKFTNGTTFLSVLVVAHRTAGGNCFFIVQNWWLEKQFIEVDWEYLQSCMRSAQSQVVSCYRDLFQVPTTYTIDAQEFVECADCGDDMIEQCDILDSTPTCVAELSNSY
jgi:hypothetical protein